MAGDEPDGPGGRGDGVTIVPRHGRRLSDKVLAAFHHACDQADFDVAEALLNVLSMVLDRPAPAPDLNRRRNLELLVTAHERLWHLRHPEEDR